MDWKGVKKIVIITAIILGLIIVFAIAARVVESVGISITSHEDTIKRMISRKYPNYEISDLKLQYVDFYSTVREADEDDRPTSAEAVIKSEDEQRTLEFKRVLFFWVKVMDEPDYGSNVPDDIYFTQKDALSLGKAVDIDNYIFDNNILVIPNKDGSLYTKVGTKDDWYYSIWYYKNIYKTLNGKVYFFNGITSNWEESNKTYSELVHYANFTKTDKEFVLSELRRLGYSVE